ncbi:MAG: hypothetical protein JHC88_00095 [Niveispirillum sp.]|nr:hypothetical protein [Niveispirillum sp.]
MATISGGQTIATVGTTAEENNQLSNLLQTTFSNVTSITSTEVVPTSANTVTLPTPTLLGTFEATSIVTQAVSASSAGGVAVVNTDKSGSSSGNSLTNLIVDSNAGAVIFSGSGNANTVTGMVLPTGGTTSLIVGNAGSQIVDGSRSTVNTTIFTGTGNDTVVTGSGSDSIKIGDIGIANGGAGADTLIGGTGTATLGGGLGADSIVAATGGGVIIGEVGNDSLVAGAGKDVFVYRTGDGNDAITGFNPAADTLALAISGVDLTSIISNATVSGGNTIITMPDGSTITLAGVTGINVNWFTIK